MRAFPDLEAQLAALKLLLPRTKAAAAESEAQEPNQGATMAGDKPQPGKFEVAARELGCDDDPERFRERVGKLARHKPAAARDAILDVNQGADLEAEADAMAARAMQHKPVERPE
jgi:hypothetical protein